MDHSLRQMRFRALLRTLREEAGLSQLALAERLGKPQTFVSKAELSERRMDFLETLDFCAACNLSPSQLTARLREAGINVGIKPTSKRRSPRNTTTKAG